MNDPKIYAISDLHGSLPDPKSIPECDILLIGGDSEPVDDHSFYRQLDWTLGPYREWLREVPARIKIQTPGNHSFLYGESTPDDQRRVISKLIEVNCFTLIDQGGTFLGLNIYGTPWTPTFGRWTFMKPEHVLADIFAQIPDGLDILLSHGPPRGQGDRNLHGDHVGSTALAERIRIAKPRAVVCGHIHEGYGWYLGSSKAGTVQVYNVSQMNAYYQPINEAGPIFLDQRHPLGG